MKHIRAYRYHAITFNLEIVIFFNLFEAIKDYNLKWCFINLIIKYLNQGFVR